jgi:hypothetical protein
MGRSPTYVLLLAVACAGLRDGVYGDGRTRYRVGPVSESWQPMALQGNDLSWVSRNSPHTLAINATCADHDDPTLEVLTRHLLMGFSARQTLEHSVETLDGRAALRSHVVAELDGVPVELMLVVLKKNGCVYDFTYVSPVGRLDERLADFERSLSSFHVESKP